MVKAFIPKSEELDALLHQLIQQALQHHPETNQRTQAIEFILGLAEHLPGSLTEQRLDKGLRPYYHDALKYTAKDVYKNIDGFPKTYDLNIANEQPAVVRKYFVRWYNQILKCDCRDEWKKRRNRPKPVSLDESVGEEGGTTRYEITPSSTLEPMTAAILAENQRIWQEIISYIQHNTDGELGNCCSHKYPICNCWEIARRRLLQEPPQRWEDIAKELNVPYGNITSHWHRKCKPLLKEILQKLGYQPN